ncbi:phosphotransferase family protein [Agromyces ramosus]|uniref:5-methylthioribose kinase n=1 Tax=Agromyces ramosus TaxID=33879 RepID=A0ABU0R7C2_9MICO|nr:aminoglycoside phosphotransferase family protein [Agromyces ramosus]MDQ0893983.1 5-methylthioribose kinase [Agromyces ramosus]
MSDPLATGRTQLTVESVVDYVADRGIEVGGRNRVTALVGGVSGSVFLVEGTHRRIVVKQALDQLLVKDPWFAKPERAQTEAAALDLFHKVTGGHVPELLDSDDDRFTLVMTAAPSTWRPWKTDLLAGDFDADAARATAWVLGSVLANWHRATHDDRATAERFADDEAFEQLRVGPFHRTVLARHPDLDDPIEQCVRDLVERRECLVHGDFSPKNVLVDPIDPERGWVLDFEVARYGAAVFDLAFLHCHLILKAIHNVARSAALGQVATEFQASYAAAAGPALTELASSRLGWQTACLLLARVDGTSPAGYLTPSERALVSEFAIEMLSTPDRPIHELWAHLRERTP